MSDGQGSAKHQCTRITLRAGTQDAILCSTSQILYKTDHSGASGAYCLRRLIRQILFKCFKSFTKRSILEPRAPHGSGGPSARSFLNASYPSQILYKTEHSGASGASWLRRLIRQILAKGFKSFTNPLQNRPFWSLGRLIAQEPHPPDPFQMLQILYKSFTKRSVLEPGMPRPTP